MFDHITITASDYMKSRALYEATLRSLGMSVLYEEPGVMTGFGVDRPAFWVSKQDKEHPASTNLHIAFRCEDRKTVDIFYAGAIAAGGRDNGAPGLRPQYHDKYYAAFVLDPDGNNIEIVCGNS